MTRYVFATVEKGKKDASIIRRKRFSKHFSRILPQSSASLIRKKKREKKKKGRGGGGGGGKERDINVRQEERQNLYNWGGEDSQELDGRLSSAAQGERQPFPLEISVGGGLGGVKKITSYFHSLKSNQRRLNKRPPVVREKKKKKKKKKNIQKHPHPKNTKRRKKKRQIISGILSIP